MRTIIYCFSGTGNTRRACEGLVRSFKALGHEADIYMLTAENSPPPPNGYDRIVVAYPVHAFNAPAPILKFLKKLPKCRQFIPSYLLRTSGEPLKLNHASGILPKRILKKKGYPVRGELHYVMPYNIIFKHSDGMAARMLHAMEVQLPKDAKMVLAGTGNLERINPLRRFVSFVLRIEHPAMPLIGRTFKSSKDCTGCGLCAKSCPQGNIKIVDGKPKFGGACVGCMSCSFRCPKDAMRISVLNGWRVNGGYYFEGEPATDDEVCGYCRKSYVRYFHSIEDEAMTKALERDC